ncbi:MAG: hypothetical protein Q8J85_07900 [Sulfuricurvum sp.]|nr:hypothetical protein [Sulfuricurvum sp.]MDP3023161.1 hypothetical protein [Sulfuricurvum sp.]
MLKKLLIALALLTASANANFFEALKDAAEKVIEEQNRLNNTGEDNSPATSDQEITPQFNSLAEEVAYKKKKAILEEQQKVAEEKQYKEKEKSKRERSRAKENAIAEKYFIKHTDSLEMIDSKFKNRVRLFSEMPKDYKELGEIDNDATGYVGVDTEIYLNFGGRSSGVTDYFFHLQQCQNQDCTQEAFKEYEQYLRESYETYGSRQAENERNAKMLQAEKEYRIKVGQHNAKILQDNAKILQEQKSKVLKINEERKKVQSACQAWRANAKKGVYSLGVGDQIVSKQNILYLIRGVEANTFLINVGGQSVYVQKSEYIPYLSINTAPSKYCYQ